MDGRQGPAGQGPLPGRSAGAPRPLSRDRVRPGAPRVAALDALLRDVDALRTTLQTDLSLVAGALEAGEPSLAASVLDSDRHDVAAFEGRALGHLSALQVADSGEARDAEVTEVRALPVRLGRQRPRRLPRRLTRILPATPLVAAAAALVGLFGAVPGSTAREAPTTDVSGAVLSSWAELSRLSATDAPADEVQRAARSLNADIASMVARAGGDPDAARQAIALLREAQAVLAADDDADQLQTVLQQSRVLAARLLASLPPVAPGLPAPVRSTVDRLPGDVAAPPPRPLPRYAQSAAEPAPRSAPAARSGGTRSGAARSEGTRTEGTRVPSPRASTSPSAGPSSSSSSRPAAGDPLRRPTRPPSLPTAAIDPPLQ